MSYHETGYDPYGFGVLNKFSKSDILKKLDPSRTEFFNSTAELVAASYKDDILSNTGPYVGIVLRREPTTVSEVLTDDSWAGQLNNYFEGFPTEIIRLKARIPEIHSMYPFPSQFDHGDSGPGRKGEWQKIIDMYPTFVSMNVDAESEDGLPEPGQLVWLDFADKNNYRNGIYIGPVDIHAGGPPQINRNIEDLRDKSEWHGDTKTVGDSTQYSPPDNAKEIFCPGNQPKKSTTKDATSVPRIDFSRLGRLDENMACDRKGFDFFVLHDGGRWGNANAETAIERLIDMWSGKGVSSHYFIDADGTIFQLVSEKFRANHGGCRRKKKGPEKCPISSVNQRSIGIDLRWKNEMYTNEQYISLNYLLKDISRRRGIPLDDQHILAHFEVAKFAHYDPRGPNNVRKPKFPRDFNWSNVTGVTYDHWAENAPRALAIVRDEHIGSNVPKTAIT